MINLIIMCGNTGVGKTYIANLISQKTGCWHIRGTEVMAELGYKPPEPWPHEYRIKKYKRIFEKAKLLLENGKSVILDSLFNLEEFRNGAKKLAEETGSNYIIIEVICDEKIVSKRLSERVRNKSETPHFEIHKLRGEQFEPIKEPHYIINNSSGDIEKKIDDIISKLV
jgi:predicted kinase